MSLLKIEPLKGIEPGNEMIDLVSFEEGLYYSNNTLWLVDKSSNVYSLWVGLQDYFESDVMEEDESDAKPDSKTTEDYTCPEIPLDRARIGEISQTNITQDLLLKVIAVAQDPSLAFKNE